MGNWAIHIEGVGPHGNSRSEDAEQLYKKFIAELKAAGHTVGQKSIHMSGAYFEPEFIPPVREVK